MREIKFRGKRVDNGEWVYGDYSRYSKDQSIIMVDLLEEEDYWVSNETVGQYTGLKDKNGVEIYEGDIVRHGYINQHGSFFDNYAICYSEKDGAFMVGDHKRLTKKMIKQYSIEVTGNIHDNPELLEVGE